MKRLIMILLTTTICLVAVNAAPLSERQQKDIAAKINKTASGLKSMSCTFSQTKHLSLLSDKLLSEGKMCYRQPDRLRWEYKTPYRYLFIFNGTKVYVGNDQRKDVIDTGSNRIFKEVARIMMNTVTGKALSDISEFTVSVSDGNAVWIVTLIPKKKELKKMFAKITLSFSKSDLMISEINIFEKNNDRTEIRLKNIKKNIALNESLFTIPAK